MLKRFKVMACASLISGLAWAQQVPTPTVEMVFPQSPSSLPDSEMPAALPPAPVLVMPDTPGAYVEGPRVTPRVFDLTYADRANATRLLETDGPSGPTDTASAAWPAVASAEGTVLMATQGRFRVTDRCGNTLRDEAIGPFLGISNPLTSPSVIYDPWTSRWAMLWLETNSATQTSRYILVVTTTAGSFDTGPWALYAFDARSGSGANLAFADAPRLGYGPRGLSFASDQYRYSDFTYTGSQTIMVSNDVFQLRGVIAYRDFFAASENVLGIYPAKLQSTAFDLDALFVATRRAGGSDLWMWRVYNAFGTRSGTPTTMPVEPYSPPPPVTQPGGPNFVVGVDCRLWSAVATADGATVKLHVVHNSARSDPTAQAMVFAHRIVVSTATVEETAFYVYGGNPHLAMYAPTVAVGYEGTRAIAYTLSGDATLPHPEVLVSNPSLSLAVTTIQSGFGFRNANRFGFGVGADLDWNDYAEFGQDNARRFVFLGQYGTTAPSATPTAFASVQNDAPGGLSYLGPNPIVFHKAPGASSFTPASINLTVASSFSTDLRLRAESALGLLTLSPSSFTIAPTPGYAVVTASPSAFAGRLGNGIHRDLFRVAACNNFSLFYEVPVAFTVGCIADIDDGSGTGQADGGVTIDDLLYFLHLFSIGDPDADIDDGSGTATPDGGVTIDDLLYYLERFNAGC